MLFSSALKRYLFILALLASFTPGQVARADAIVVSQAMFASTIAEYFVEEGQVRVELEIGEPDFDMPQCVKAAACQACCESSCSATRWAAVPNKSRLPRE